MNSPMQSGLRRANPYAYNPAYRMHYPIEGNVVAVHFPADSTNLSKREVEYDVQPTVVSLGRLYNVPLALGAHGVVDDQEVLLRPASLVIPSGAFDAEHLNPSSTDGDRVLVQFVNGSYLTPVITHLLNHNYRGVSGKDQNPKLDGVTEILMPGPAGGDGYPFGDGSTGKTEADMGQVPGNRLVHHKINGTHLAVDANGDVFVNFKEHPDEVRGLSAGAVTKKLVVQNEGTDYLRIEKVGSNLNFVIGEALAATLLVKVGDGAKSVAIADYLQTLYTQATTGIKAIYEAHVHPTGVGPSGPPVPPNNLMPAWDSNINSTKVKVPQN